MTTHGELVSIAARWLKRVPRCRVVLTEPRTISGTGAIEQPDVIGWVRGFSIVVECKVSRADFLADERKKCREMGNGNYGGLGHWRFYLTAPGVAQRREIPPGWGLYELRGQRIFHVAGIKYANAAQPPFESCRASEVAILVQAVAKAEWEKKDGS